MIEVSNANLEALKWKELLKKDCQADILRLDRIHPVVSGNKWFKLKYYLEEAIAAGKNRILTFGGAWSNHIIATACAAEMKGLRATGIIRGERPSVLSDTLRYALEYGMDLVFVPRQNYKEKQGDQQVQAIINDDTGIYVIPEGGSGQYGVKGAGEILSLVPQGYHSHILCAIGTGTMFNGLLNASGSGQVVTGIPVLKGMADLELEYSSFMKEDRKPGARFFYDYHFGGYAKKTPELIRFMNEFYHNTGVVTDFVYTAKLMYAFNDLLKKDYFRPGSKILLIHSGGLQGNISLPKGTLEF